MKAINLHNSPDRRLKRFERLERFELFSLSRFPPNFLQLCLHIGGDAQVEDFRDVDLPFYLSGFPNSVNHLSHVGLLEATTEIVTAELIDKGFARRLAVIDAQSLLDHRQSFLLPLTKKEMSLERSAQKIGQGDRLVSDHFILDNQRMGHTR